MFCLFCHCFLLKQPITLYNSDSICPNFLSQRYHFYLFPSDFICPVSCLLVLLKICCFPHSSSFPYIPMNIKSVLTPALTTQRLSLLVGHSPLLLFLQMISKSSSLVPIPPLLYRSLNFSNFMQ